MKFVLFTICILIGLSKSAFSEDGFIEPWLPRYLNNGVIMPEGWTPELGFEGVRRLAAIRSQGSTNFQVNPPVISDSRVGDGFIEPWSPRYINPQTGKVMPEGWTPESGYEGVRRIEALRAQGNNLLDRRNVRDSDSDGDGIPDDVDLCSNTSRGSTVWQTGIWAGCAGGQHRNSDLPGFNRSNQPQSSVSQYLHESDSQPQRRVSTGHNGGSSAGDRVTAVLGPRRYGDEEQQRISEISRQLQYASTEAERGPLLQESRRLENGLETLAERLNNLPEAGFRRGICESPNQIGVLAHFGDRRRLEERAQEMGRHIAEYLEKIKLPVQMTKFIPLTQVNFRNSTRQQGAFCFTLSGSGITAPAACKQISEFLRLQPSLFNNYVRGCADTESAIQYTGNELQENQTLSDQHGFKLYSEPVRSIRGYVTVRTNPHVAMARLLNVLYSKTNEPVKATSYKGPNKEDYSVYAVADEPADYCSRVLAAGSDVVMSCQIGQALPAGSKHAYNEIYYNEDGTHK
jgi:hypothetical protein